MLVLVCVSQNEPPTGCLRARCQGVVCSAVCFEAQPFEFYGFVRTRRVFWDGIFLPQPRAKRSEMFLVCVVFVVKHEQDRTAEAQTFQRMHHQRWVGRAAERCLDATTSSVVCVGVGVCVPKCTTSSLLSCQGVVRSAV